LERKSGIVDHKIGACEFIDYINPTSEEVFGQMRHLDGMENSDENRYRLFLPIKISSKNSGQGISNLEPVGTRIISDCNFMFDKSPNIPEEAWKFDTPTTNLIADFQHYSCIVVNKVPHGGGKQVPFSRRVTLFLYIVPMNWIDVKELDITIPAINFLMKWNDGLVDLKDLNDNEEIKKWIMNVKGSGEHFLGLVDFASKQLKNQKAVVRFLDQEDNKISKKRRF
jgi:hypothetical protein